MATTVQSILIIVQSFSGSGNVEIPPYKTQIVGSYSPRLLATPLADERDIPGYHKINKFIHKFQSTRAFKMIGIR